MPSTHRVFIALLITISLSPALLPGQAELAPVVCEIRSHDIGFLTADIQQFPLPVSMSVGALKVGSSQEDEGAAGAFFDAAGADVPPGVGMAPSAIAKLIQTNIGEDTWSNSKNSIRVRGSTLVVVQTSAIQTEIEDFLAQLRARRARMVTVDVALVPVDALSDDFPSPLTTTRQSAPSAVATSAHSWISNTVPRGSSLTSTPH